MADGGRNTERWIRWIRWIRWHRYALALALAAALLRLHRISPVFSTSDAADLAYSIVRHVCGDGEIADALSDLTLFRLGSIQPMVVYVQALVVEAWGGSLDAVGWVLSTVVVSSASVFLAYLLGRELVNRAAGLWAGALLALSPIHIMLGRHLGAPWAYEIFFQLLLMWLLVRQIRKPATHTLAALCCALALYVWCGNQMLAIFPVLGFGAFVGHTESRERTFWSYLRTRFVSAWWLVPLASIAWLGWVTLEYREGHLAHALFDKQKELGWYLLNWLKDSFRDIGHGPTWIGLMAAFGALTTGRRLLTLQGLPFVYFLCYSVPFWIWISRKTTLTVGYVVYSITGLLLLTALVPFRVSGGKLQHWVPAFSAILLLLGSCSSVYKHVGLKRYLGVRGFQGTYRDARATTAAAAYIRELDGSNRGRVFSDASGGTGLEPPIMRLYFRRPSHSLYDAPSPRVPYRKFRRKRDEIDYLVVEPKNTGLVSRYFGDAFDVAAQIVGRRERPRLLVYARELPADGPATLTVQDGHRRYREVYPKLCSDYAR